jgi:hypothetical protein
MASSMYTKFFSEHYLHDRKTSNDLNREIDFGTKMFLYLDGSEIRRLRILVTPASSNRSTIIAYFTVIHLIQGCLYPNIRNVMGLLSACEVSLFLSDNS